MSTWTTPVTWAASAVTVATMNTEVRDHLNWLKGALNIITNSTAADTGATTQLDIRRTAASSDAFTARQSGDTFSRWGMQAGGTMTWGGGAAATDLTLSRSAAGTLQIDHNSTGSALQVDIYANAGTTQIAQLGVRSNPDTTARALLSTEAVATKAGLVLGSGSVTGDVNLYRYSANVLATDDQFAGAGGVGTKTKAGVPSDADITLATDGVMILDTTNHRIYFRSAAVWKYAALT